MPQDAWTSEQSPFHQGEQEVQERLGVREKMEAFGRRVIRDHMPDEHRAFYGALPFLLVGSVDGEGRPWASILAGPPGFLTSPDARRLRVAARPLPGDPLNETLAEGADIGLLGMQLETRRRNRMNGRVTALGDSAFEVTVDQSFGNCPQYIQTRAVAFQPDTLSKPVDRSDRLDDAARAMIGKADTLFIATSTAGEKRSADYGADVSHRGGKPGFVQVEDDRTFVFPDFAGNLHFNTVGNLVVNPRAGFLFVDFASGDLLYLTGRTEIVWQGEDLAAFIGAERLIRFTVDAVIRVEGGLPLRFDFGEYSPMLAHTGSWEQAAGTMAAEQERNTYLDYDVFKVEKESETISSFYLKRADGKGLATYEPGQYLPIRLEIPGRAEPAVRTYTLSDAPNPEHYRLSIKREPGNALVSNFFHDHVGPGFRLQAMAPRGHFTLSAKEERPAVLISAGVGITPMIAMVNRILKEGQRTRHYRPTHFIHGAANGTVQAFGPHLRRLAAEQDFLRLHVRFSQPGPADRLGETHDSEGRIDVDLLKAFLPFDDHDFYLCGPPGFMQSLYDGLTGLGVRPERISYEAFGPATVLTHEPAEDEAASRRDVAEGPVKVAFAKSGIEATWSPDQGTLLELAEAEGLSPAFACRSGICGTCATPIKCGDVDYLEEPSAPHGDDEVLICCSTPRSASGDQSCGEDVGVILDL